ncbi:MAG: acyltransferase [Acidobacteriaceae bacterium]|nr:acyltransferase [Acidobacteriaceae bacterium]
MSLSLRTRALFRGSLHELWVPPRHQIPFLDGLRAIAVLLVINEHFNASFTALYGQNLYSRIPFVADGWMGVDLFFVLSGFFIGSQLWKELRRENSVSIGRFILRRGLRIWPLYFFMFFAILLIYWRGAAANHYGWADLFFVSNYFGHRILVGAWSLSTEEQFYIVTPVLLYFFASGRKQRTIRAVLWTLLLLIAAMRAAIWIHRTGHFFSHSTALFQDLYSPFHTHCDGLIMGLILSNLWVSRHERAVAGRWKSYALAAGGLVVFIALRQLQYEVLIFAGLALFFGSLVWFGLNSGVRWFQSRLFYWLSRLSFGMYLNHAYMRKGVLAMMRHAPFLKPASIVSQLSGTVLLTAVSAAVALVTFCLVEHPFLNLRAKVLGTSREAKAAPLAR